MVDTEEYCEFPGIDAVSVAVPLPTGVNVDPVIDTIAGLLEVNVGGNPESPNADNVIGDAKQERSDTSTNVIA